MDRQAGTKISAINRTVTIRQATQQTERQFVVVMSNSIRIIGGWMDPTAGARGRLWWVFAMAVYAAWAGSLFSGGRFTSTQFVLGLLMLAMVFVVAFVVGVVRETRRLRRNLVDDRAEDDGQVTNLTGISQAR